jgi:SAM-dependent methyltransferase
MGPVSGSTKAPAGHPAAPQQTATPEVASDDVGGRPPSAARSPLILPPDLSALDDAPALPVRARPDSLQLSRHRAKLRQLVDRVLGEVILCHTPGRRVLDLGHGADVVTEWVRTRAGSLRVVDAVDLGHGAEIRLPFADGAFDLVYSLRTLPHLGHDERSSESAARSALAEIGRVLAPRGTALVQIDNPRSLWGAYYGIRNPSTAIERAPLLVESDRGITRFDTLPRLMAMLPPTLTKVGVHGARITVTLPHTLSIPIIGRWIERLEWSLRDRPPFRSFGAHLLVALRRID